MITLKHAIKLWKEEIKTTKIEIGALNRNGMKDGLGVFLDILVRAKQVNLGLSEPVVFRWKQSSIRPDTYNIEFQTKFGFGFMNGGYTAPSLVMLNLLQFDDEFINDLCEEADNLKVLEMLEREFVEA